MLKIKIGSCDGFDKMKFGFGIENADVDDKKIIGDGSVDFGEGGVFKKNIKKIY